MKNSKKFDTQLKRLINWQIKENEEMLWIIPSSKLKEWWFSSDLLSLDSDLLIRKSKQPNHIFDIKNLEWLDDALQNPIAVFGSRNPKYKWRKMIFTEIKDEKTGNNFVGIFQVENKKWINKVNNAVSIHPRNKKSIQAYLSDPNLIKFLDNNKLNIWKKNNNIK